jgi:hypothetical protein
LVLAYVRRATANWTKQSFGPAGRTGAALATEQAQERRQAKRDISH